MNSLIRRTASDRTVQKADELAASAILRTMPRLKAWLTPQITSYSGVTINAHARLAEVEAADGVFIVSGDGSRAQLANGRSWKLSSLNRRAK